MPQVASESSTYALSRSLTANARPSYAADRAAATTPFESLIDDAPARPAPEPRAQRAADDSSPPADRPQSRADASQSTKSDDKSRPDKPDAPANDSSAADSAKKNADTDQAPADAKASDKANDKAGDRAGEKSAKKSDEKTADQAATDGAASGDLKAAADDATVQTGDPAAGLAPGQTPVVPDAAAIPTALNGAAVPNDAPPADDSDATDAIATATAKAGQPQVLAALQETAGKADKMAGKKAEAGDGKTADTAGAKADAKTGVATDAKTGAKTDATASAATGLKTAAQTDAKADAKPSATTEAQAAVATDADPAAAPEAEAAATADAKVAAKIDAKTSAQTDAASGTKADAKTATAADPNATTLPAADAKAQAGTGEPHNDVSAQTAANDHRGVGADGDAKSGAKSGTTPRADNNAVVPKPGADPIQPQVLTAPAPAAALATTAAAPAATAAPTVATAAHDSAPVLFAGVAFEITSKALAGKNHFDIRLDPPDLGRIHVRLDVDKDGNVISHMVADRTDTLDLLRRDSSGLERALQDAGLKTSNNSLQFSLSDQSANRQQSDDNDGADRARLMVEDEQLNSVEPLQRNYTRYAGQTAGLDIRV